MTKIYAFYLPQFHRTPENDKWWGQGFTEWTTVKNAKPLFTGHDQPHEPLEYYNLLEKETMEKQASLMQEYGVDGMCFYHYYFENGRKILEKPAENLLKWQDINMPFCFYWANQSWARTWSNMQDVNVWTSSCGNNAKQEGDEILLKQGYGDEKQWKEHFEYLLPFFKDSRYIKKDGRPVFIIYKPEDISCLAQMKDCWDRLMEREGLPPVYFIGKNTYAKVLDGYLDHEPQFVLAEMAGQKYTNEYGISRMLDYDEVWHRVIRNHEIGEHYFYGGFVGYDDTPRHGSRGTVIYGQTPKKFRKYMICLLIKAKQANCDMVFLNAWNEWGEGMYLEEDREYRDGYLLAIKEAKQIVSENEEILTDIIIDGIRVSEKVERETTQRLNEINERYRDYWQILNRWLNLHLDGKSVFEYFNDRKIKSVAIYGLGMLGTLLYKELKNTEIELAYGIDQDTVKSNKFDIPVQTLETDLKEVDVIVVTVGYAYEEIKKKILNKGDFNVISLDKIIEYASR